MPDHENSLYRASDTARALTPTVRSSVGPEPYRSPYRRDYARLIHSAAFRRLQGKTQVFPGEESDFFRNRLTHSLEVAQIATAIARRLNHEHTFFRTDPINAEIVEVAGLAHDLGHPPFGHNGERALDDCMRGVGGFEGNAQTLRIIGRLEKKDARNALPIGVDEDGRDFRLGLNLPYRSLAAVLKYDRMIPLVRAADEALVKGYYTSESSLVQDIKKNVLPTNSASRPFRTIECSIMDVADDIAYSTYDLEDTFKVGFLTPLDIVSCGETEVLESVARKVSRTTKEAVTTRDVVDVLTAVFRDLFRSDSDVAKLTLSSPGNIVYVAGRYALASREVADYGYLRTALTASLVSEFMAGVQVKICEEAPVLSEVFLKPEVWRKVEVLKHLTHELTIKSPRLRVSEHRGYGIIKRMVDELFGKDCHLLLPPDFREIYRRVKNEDERKRVICDFVAGMTDRYAVEYYGRLFSESPQSIFKPY